ncbi:DUF4041 domain-containing protein [Dulcicalothrix desertica]|uniref:DUF4041 domain-containing protein n=1 Tax=Dulcicalothrix desertica TaxID=32056 RepID=UPI00191F0578|nr:DUF4041 domain-containing protein [Dulcicalothrix desertica]
MLVALLLLAILGLTIGFTQQIQKIKKEAKIEQDKLRESLSKYDGLVSKEKYEDKLDENIVLKESEIKKLQIEQDNIYAQTRTIQQKLTEVHEEEYIQRFAFYKSKYNFGSSEEYKFKLDKIRNKQKSLLKNDAAATCYTKWEVENSAKKGKKMISDYLTVVLRAFNGECDAAILQVKYNNITKLETRINKAFETLNKLAETNHCAITRDYFNAKLEELYLTHEFQEKKQEELEEQRRIKEQMRDEERALREIEKAKQDAEKEEKRYRLALEKARQEVEQATGRQREVLENKLQQLNQQLQAALENKERAISRAQMTKSGYVYVISNIGSFGEMFTK